MQWTFRIPRIKKILKVLVWKCGEVVVALMPQVSGGYLPSETTIALLGNDEVWRRSHTERCRKIKLDRRNTTGNISTIPVKRKGLTEKCGLRCVFCLMKKYSLLLLSISRSDITKRSQMKISVVLTDTWPKNHVYWTSHEWLNAQVTKQKQSWIRTFSIEKKNRHNIRIANQKHI